MWKPSFVDGCGGKAVLAPIWPLATSLLTAAKAVSLKAISNSVALLVMQAKIVAEGAGACGVAAALQDVVRQDRMDEKATPLARSADFWRLPGMGASSRGLRGCCGVPVLGVGTSAWSGMTAAVAQNGALLPEPRPPAASLPYPLNNGVLADATGCEKPGVGRRVQKIVCVVSGGGIDTATLISCLRGKVPSVGNRSTPPEASARQPQVSGVSKIPAARNRGANADDKWTVLAVSGLLYVGKACFLLSL